MVVEVQKTQQAAITVRKLAISLLKESWFNDAQVATLCAAGLDLIALAPDFSPLVREVPELLTRAHWALETLDMVCDFQRTFTPETPVNFKSYPDPYAKTKTVLWRTMLVGWNCAAPGSSERSLAKAILATFIASGEAEEKALSETLRKTFEDGWARKDKLRRLLHLASEKSNPAIVRFFSHMLVNQLSPAEVAAMVAT